MDGSGHHFANKSNFNGLPPYHQGGGHHPHHHHNQSQQERKWKTYKLLVDPTLKKGHQKLYRYDGFVPGAVDADLNATDPKDPRSKLTRLLPRTEQLDLPVPKFTVDKYFVGELPLKQITFTNLNDNVREHFLRSMCQRYGEVESIRIFHHPRTNKHLGLALVAYTKTRYAKEAALALNRTSVMGKIIIVQVDAGGKECQRTFDCLVNNTTPSTPGGSSVSSGPRDPRGRAPSETPSQTPSLPPTPHPDRLGQFSGDPIGGGFTPQAHDGFFTPSTPSDAPMIDNRFNNMNRQQDFEGPPPPPPPSVPPFEQQTHAATLSDFMHSGDRNMRFKAPFPEPPIPPIHREHHMMPNMMSNRQPQQPGFGEPPGIMAPPPQPFYPRGEGEWSQGSYGAPQMQKMNPVPSPVSEESFHDKPLPYKNTRSFTPEPDYGRDSREPLSSSSSHSRETKDEATLASKLESHAEPDHDDYEQKKREKNRRKRRNLKEKRLRERTASSQLGDLILPQVSSNRSEHSSSRSGEGRRASERRASITSELGDPHEAAHHSQEEEDDEFHRSLDSRIEALLEESHAAPIEFGLKSPERRASTNSDEVSKPRGANDHPPISSSSGIRNITSSSTRGQDSKNFGGKEGLRRNNSSGDPGSRHSRKGGSPSRTTSYEERRGNKGGYRGSSRYGDERDRWRRRPSTPPPSRSKPDSGTALGDLSPENIGDSPLDDMMEDNPPGVPHGSAEQSLSSTTLQDEVSERLSFSHLPDSKDGNQRTKDHGGDEDRMSMSPLSDAEDTSAQLQVHSGLPPGLPAQLALPGEPPPPGSQDTSNAADISNQSQMFPWGGQDQMPSNSMGHQMGPNANMMGSNSGPFFPNFPPWMGNPNFSPSFQNGMFGNPGGGAGFPPNFFGPMNRFDGPPGNFPGNFPPFGQFPMGPGGPMPLGGGPFPFPPGFNPGMNLPNFDNLPPAIIAHLQMMSGMSGMFRGTTSPMRSTVDRPPTDFSTPPRGLYNNGPVTQSPQFMQDFIDNSQQQPSGVQDFMMNMAQTFPESPGQGQQPLPVQEGDEWATPLLPSDPDQLLITSVLESMVLDLKKVVKKDLDRKIVEVCAFKTFDTWWEESLAKSKPIKEEEPKGVEPKVERPLPPSILDTKEWTKSLTSNNENFNLGLGFLGGMPRMPSFKVKRKKPSVDKEIERRDKEDKDKSRPITPPMIDEDMSDTEKDAIETSSQQSDEETSETTARETADSRRSRILSSSSEESEAEEEEDEDEEEEEEEEDKAEKVRRRKTKSDEFIDDGSESSEDEGEDDESGDESDEESSSSSEEEEEGETLSSRKSSKRKLETIEEENDGERDGDEESASKRSEQADVAENEPVIPEEGTVPSPTTPHAEPGLPSSATTTSHDESSDGLEKMKLLAEIASHPEDFTKKKDRLPRIELFKLSEDEISDAKRKASVDGDTDEMVDVETSQDDELQPAKIQRSASLVDHNYCMEPTVDQTKAPPSDKDRSKETTSVKSEEKKKDRKRKRKSQLESLFDVFQEVPVAPEPTPEEEPVKAAPDYSPRNYYEEWSLLYDFLGKGLDREDGTFLRRSYEILLQDGRIPWLSYTHWVPHSLTFIPNPPAKRQRKEDVKSHSSGSARTEGYYKITDKEKMEYMQDSKRMVADQLRVGNKKEVSTTEDSKKATRDSRSDQRRIMATIQQKSEVAAVSDLLKFNQLKFRKKDLKFAKSGIHGWGLYAMQDIAADEMVIEYVGEGIRQSIAEERELHYNKIGIGSSYLFRIDSGCIIDATKCGNLARFINHSCMPNCYAQIINVDSAKKITIYSKEPIRIGEEITYDYKFPIEDDKIVCLCGTPQCRGTLN